MLHGAQVGGLVDVPGAVCMVPAGQLSCALHWGELGLAEVVPGSQVWQIWLVVWEPAVLMNSPGTHWVQVLQDAQVFQGAPVQIRHLALPRAHRRRLLPVGRR